MNETVKKTIAVVGVSLDQSKYGYKIFKDLLKSEYVVYGVNSKGGNVLKHTLYKSLHDLPMVPHLVMTVVPPHVTELIVDDCIKLGVKRIWMQPGSESDVAINKAKEKGIDVVSQQCFMKLEGLWK